jgi:hypothetical protein
VERQAGRTYQRIHSIYGGVMIVFSRCYMSVTKVLQVLQGCYNYLCHCFVSKYRFVHNRAFEAFGTHRGLGCKMDA